MSDRIATVQDLVAAREARGLGPDDVMRQLKLAPRQLQALEQGDWAALPGHAFVRGVLRGYGRMLGVDVEPLVEAMSSTVHAADLRPAASLDQPLPRRSMLGFGSGGSGSRVAWILLLAVGVLALAFFFGGADLGSVGSWLARDRAGAGAASSEAPAQAAPGDRGAPGTTTETVPIGPLTPGPSDPAQGAPSAPASPAGPAVPAPDGAPAGQSGATAAPVAAVAVAAGSAQSASASQAPVLRLTFERESWLEAKRDGKVLVSGNQPAGSSRELPIEAATVLVIGNAATVRAELAGQAVDLVPHTRGSVARLTLP